MWYKYLNRQTDNLRIFRRANLKFNQDDYGMFKNKFLGKKTDLLFRMARTEGVLRGSFLLLGIGLVGSLLWVKGTYYDPVYTAPKLIEQKRKEQQANRKARQTLYYNNLGAPTRPTRNMNDFITFIASGEAINRSFDYLDNALYISNDQMKGLDSYSTQNDERMVDLYLESKKKSGGH